MLRLVEREEIYQDSTFDEDTAPREPMTTLDRVIVLGLLVLAVVFGVWFLSNVWHGLHVGLERGLAYANDPANFISRRH